MMLRLFRTALAALCALSLVAFGDEARAWVHGSPGGAAPTCSPSSVNSAGLCAVLTLPTNASMGLTGCASLTTVTSGNATSLIPGATVNTGGAAGSYIQIPAGTYSRLDFYTNGYTVLVGNATVTLNCSKLGGNTTTGLILAVGNFEGVDIGDGGTLNLNNDLLDGTNSKGNASGAIQIGQGGTVACDFCQIQNTPFTAINLISLSGTSTNTFNCTDTYMTAMGTDSNPADHVEFIHIINVSTAPGTVACTRLLMDAKGLVTTGVTGFAHDEQTSSGTSSMSFSSTIAEKSDGDFSSVSNYDIQGSSGATLTFPTVGVWQIGSSGFTVMTVTCTGHQVNFNTGANLC